MSLEIAVKMLEEVENIIKNLQPKDEDFKLIEQILIKNMNIEAEIYAKYIRK